MNILEEIIENKKVELQNNKSNKYLFKKQFFEKNASVI
jgi:hypothetical protein